MDTLTTNDLPIQKNVNNLEKISFIVLLITIIIVPIVFIPTTYAPLDMVKTIVITMGILISSILYFISAYNKKSLYIPKHPLTIIGVALAISVIISGFLSTNILKSFFGQGFEISTGSLLLILFLGSLITIYLTNKEKDRILYVYGAIVVSFIIVALFQIIRLFAGTDILSFGIFQSATSTLVGKWTDLAIFSAIIAILSYISIVFLTLSKLVRSLLIVLLVISGVFIFIVNSTIVWAAMAIIMACILYYQYSISTTPSQQKGFMGIIKKLSIFTTVLLIVAIIFLWKGDIIAGPIVKSLNIVPNEVPLPWQLTLDVAVDTIKQSPIFGAGPNRFGVEYLKYKPLSVNPTPFWNAEFATGFGLIPTFLVTQGLLGFILWIIFIILFVYSGFKALRKTTDSLYRFFIVSTFFSALFMWIISLVYSPSHSILFLACILTGLFIATLSTEGYVSFKKIVKFNSTIIIAIIIICVIWISAYAKKTIALGYFQGGISALGISNNQGLSMAESDFKKALFFDKSDIYYQALSEVNILKITALAQQIQTQAQQSAKTPDSESIKNLGSLVEEAVRYTRSAIAIDPTNYYNYVAEARISEVAISLKVQNAYENTIAAYTNALVYNPYNPSLYLNLARIEASQNKLPEAQKYIGLALQLKQNYTEAIFLLSQIQVSQGQIKEAITSVQIASQINPTNPLVFFQLGLLYYNDKNYQSAVDALAKAIELNNQYANARYFLGLSYARLNRSSDAIAQFENLAQSNPDSQEVTLILSNLKAGKSPFTDAQPPIDSKPEKRKTLPVKEKVIDTAKTKTI